MNSKIKLIPFLLLATICMGCAARIYETGRFHDILQRDKDRTQIVAAMGEPIRSDVDTNHYDLTGPYDEFVVRGPVYDIGLTGGAGMGFAMTLGISDLIAVPEALWWKAFCRGPQKVKVIYDADGRYEWHRVTPVNKNERKVF